MMSQYAYVAKHRSQRPGDPGVILLMYWYDHWFLLAWMANRYRMEVCELTGKNIKTHVCTECLIELDDFDLQLYDQDRLTARLLGHYNDVSYTARDTKFISLARSYLEKGHQVFYRSLLTDD